MLSLPAPRAKPIVQASAGGVGVGSDREESTGGKKKKQKDEKKRVGWKQTRAYTYAYT